MPIGFGHIWLLAILLVIVLLFVGPKRLPELGSGMGHFLREFKKATSDMKDNVVSTEEHAGPTPPGASPPATDPPHENTGPKPAN